LKYKKIVTGRIFKYLIFTLLFPFICFAQKGDFSSFSMDYKVESGFYNGKASIAAKTDHGLINIYMAYETIVQMDKAPWLRLKFSKTDLGEDSYIVLTSLQDSASQRLDGLAMKQWRYSSAYFNGNAIKLELFVATDDREVFINVDKVEVGSSTSNQIESICGQDERVSGSDPRVGRIMDIGCTGWITESNVQLTAGHCVDSTADIIQFNVPLSLSDGTLQHPGPNDQYAIDPESFIYEYIGQGEDWAVFEVFDNPNTGLQPIAVQKASFKLAKDLSPQDIRVTGYGSDDGTANNTLQTHVGPNMGSYGLQLQYQTDTRGGNSGSPIIDDITGNAIGIHTNGGCTPFGFGNNSGTSFFNENLWAAIPPVVVDSLDPDIPENFTAYSDYKTSTSMILNWTDPLSLLNGLSIPASDFTIEVERNGFWQASVPGGVENYMDVGLNDGQLYVYEIYAKLLSNDSTGQKNAYLWICGGAPEPKPPTQFKITNPGGGKLLAHWVNPKQNIDGTPMDDLASINLYENDLLLKTRLYTTSDTGLIEQFEFTPSSDSSSYYLTAMDNEAAISESEPGNIGYAPLGLPFFDDFPADSVPSPKRWINNGGELSTKSLQPPSASHALVMNGHPVGTDSVASFPVNLADKNGEGYIVSYWYQPQGTEDDSPESYDSLFVEFRNNLGEWVAVKHYLGTTVVPFTSVTIPIDSVDAGDGATFFHDIFQFRFRNLGAPSATYYADFWFIDNVYIGSKSNDPVMLVSLLTITDTLLVNSTVNNKVTVFNENGRPGDLSFSLTETPEAPWLILSETEGVLSPLQKRDIVFTVNTTGLAAGTYNTSVVISGNDPANPTDEVALTIVVNEPPQISVNPDSVHFDLLTGEKENQLFRIKNIGSGPLSVYNLEDEDLISTTYKWIDSDNPEGPAYQYIDISGTGTLVELQQIGIRDAKDEGIATVDLPFSVKFYDDFYSQIRVSTDGFITFDTNFSSWSSNNTTLPETGEPNGMICAFWDNLDGRVGGDIYYQQLNNRFIVQWHNWGHYKFGKKNMDFQIVLFSNSDVYHIAYKHIVDNAEATIGIENMDGTLGLQIANNQAYAHDGLLIKINKDATWLDQDVTSGIVTPNDSLDVMLTVDAKGLFGGDYLSQVLINNNDPENTVYNFPKISMHVTGAPDICIDSTSVDWGKVFVNITDTMGLAIENCGVETLQITEIATSTPEFLIVGPTSFDIAAGEGYELKIVFYSDELGLFSDSLILTSNATNPAPVIPLTAEVFDAPVIGVSPLSVSDSLLSGQSSIKYFEIWNSGASTLFFDIATEYLSGSEQVIEESQSSFYMKGNQQKKLAILSEAFSNSIEKSPNKSSVSQEQKSESLWNLQLAFNVHSATGGSSNYGTEFDGSYFYSSRWDSDLIFKLDKSGNLIESFAISGVSGLRDLACDGAFMYGGSATNTIYVMDFNTKTLVGTINSPEQNVRSIAYDPEADAFWVGNWDTDITLVNRNGEVISRIPASVHGLTGISGSAYDNMSEGGPFLWLNDQGAGAGNPQYIYQFDLTTQNMTGLKHDVNVDIQGDGTVGGLFIGTGLIQGKATIGGILQGAPDIYYCYELTDIAEWVSATPSVDSVAADDTLRVPLNFNAANLVNGQYSANLHINSNDPETPKTIIATSLTVSGDAVFVVLPDTLLYKPIYTGQKDTMAFDIQNNGSADFEVSSLAHVTEDFSILTETPFTVDAFKSQQVKVVFFPDKPGTFSDSITIVHNAPELNDNVVYLFGSADDPPILSLSDTLLTTQIQENGKDSTSFYIKNEGVSNLTYKLLLSEKPSTKSLLVLKPDPLTGYSSMTEYNFLENYIGYPESGIEKIWDIQFTFDVTEASGNIGNAGAEFDGTYFYSTRWQSNLLHKYDKSGNLIEEFSIPGVTGLRDLAFDGAYMYGSAADNTIYKMDFNNKSLISTINSPAQTVRHIAYDAGKDAFWVGNYGTNITLVNRDGVVISTIPDSVHSITSMYGSAYDDISENGPFLWIYSQTIWEVKLTQIDLNSLTPTGFNYNISSDFPGVSGSAPGGLFITTDFVLGKATLGGLLQGSPNMMFCYELAGYGWVQLDHTVGSVSAGDSSQVGIFWHDTGKNLLNEGFVHVYSNDPEKPVKDINLRLDVVSGLQDDHSLVPGKYALHQNYPNPFNPSTTIKYDLKQNSKVVLKIYNLLGQKVKTLVNKKQVAGYKTRIWDGLNDFGSRVSTGIYIFRIEATGQNSAKKYVKSRKMILLK